MQGYLIAAAWWLLQVTPNPDDPGQYRDDWLSGNVWDAFVGPFIDLLGPVFYVIVALFIGGILFIYTGSMTLPLVVVILISGMLMPFLPPQLQAMVQLLLIVGVAWTLYVAWSSGGDTARL